MSDKYIAVACHFYDELEAASVKRKKCTIVYKEENTETTIEDYIVDLKTLNKEEFMILKSGLEIRLDKIVSFNNLNPQDYKNCEV